MKSNLRRKADGFTLLEMMVVVIIMAILAAIALPSYQRYITKSRLEEGKAVLNQNYLWLDKMYNKNNGYYDVKGGDLISTDILPFKYTGKDNVDTGYAFEVTKDCTDTTTKTTDANSFCLRAIPTGGQATAAGGGKECGILLMRQSGKTQIEVNGKILETTTNDGITCF